MPLEVYQLTSDSQSGLRSLAPLAKRFDPRSKTVTPAFEMETVWGLLLLLDVGNGLGHLSERKVSE